MILLIGVLHLLTAEPALANYRGPKLELVRRYLSTTTDCQKRLAALKFLEDTPAATSLIFRLGGRIDYDNRVFNSIRQNRVPLFSAIHSPRLKREMTIKMWRSHLETSRALNQLHHELKRSGEAQPDSSPYQRTQLMVTGATRWTDEIIRNENELNDAVMYALSVQAQIDPESRQDPVFSLQHGSPEERHWVWKFDRKRTQSGDYFREAARNMIRPVSETFRKSYGEKAVGPSNISEKILPWFDSQHLIGELADTMDLRDLSPEFRIRFVQALARLGVPDHPFSKLAVARDPSMNTFFGGKIPEGTPLFFIDNARLTRLMKDGKYEEAKKLLDEAEARSKALDKESDYFSVEPVVMIALRTMLVEAVANQNTFIFEPRKPKRDGDLVLAFDGFQIKVFQDAAGVITRLKVDFLSQDELSYLLPEVKKKELTVVSSVVLAPQSLNGHSNGKLNGSPNGTSSHQAVLATPLDFSDLELSETVVAEFERLNESHPGHNEFLEMAAILLTDHPEFTNSRGLGWFFQKVEKRIYLHGRAGLDIALLELETDINTYQDSREKFDRAVATEAQKRTEDEANTLAVFVRKEISLENLEAEKVYSFSYPDAPRAIDVKFSAEVVAFLKAEEGLQYLRALTLRGPVGKRAVSGVVKLHADIKRDYDWDFEIRVLRKGAHHRPIVRVLADGTWYVFKVVDRLPMN